MEYVGELLRRRRPRVTHYYQTVEDNFLPEITEQLERSSDYHARRKRNR
ncbi:hypothetical protein O9992_21590 [Vibrio lentus]|nr:hypothetical protein [Vibrio lentus]